MRSRFTIALFTAVAFQSSAFSGAAFADDPTYAKGSWTPPAWSYNADEIKTLPTVVLVMAGKTLPLRILPNAWGFGRNAHWHADFGIVSAQGDYTAPPYVPQSGEDRLTYDDPANPKTHSLSFVIRVLPNPRIPGSQFTPFEYETGPDNPPNMEKGWPYWPIILTPPAKMPPPAFLHTMAVVKRGEKPNPLDELTQVRPLPLFSIGGVRAYRLPAREDRSFLVNVVYVPLSALSAPLRQAKELPLYDGTPYTNPDPRMPHLGKPGSRKWQTWRAPCP